MFDFGQWGVMAGVPPKEAVTIVRVDKIIARQRTSSHPCTYDTFHSPHSQHPHASLAIDR